MKEVITLINSPSYEDNLVGLHKLLNKKLIQKSELCDLLLNENHLIVGEFLLNYRYFTTDNINIIFEFILKNISNADKLFVSDLIDFATNNQLSLPFRKCYFLLEQCGGDNDYSQIAYLDYLLYCEKEFVDEKLEHLLNSIIENTCCSMYSQLRANIILYVINHKSRYISNIVAYTQIDDACKTLLRNILINTSDIDVVRAFGSIYDQISKNKLTVIYPINKFGSRINNSSIVFNSYYNIP